MAHLTEIHEQSNGRSNGVPGQVLMLERLDSKDLTDELIVPMGGLQVAIRLPAELQSADRLTFDFVDGSFVVADH